MKNRAMAKKFRMRVCAMLLIVMMMLTGSCMNDLGSFAFAMDAAIAESGQADVAQPVASANSQDLMTEASSVQHEEGGVAPEVLQEAEATEETGEPEKAEGSEEPEGAEDPATEGGKPESEATEETGELEKAEGSEEPEGAEDPATESGELESEATEETGEPEKAEGSEEPEGAEDPATESGEPEKAEGSEEPEGAVKPTTEGGEPESEATEETGEPEKAEGSEGPDGAVDPASESGEPESEATEETGEAEKAEGSEEPEGAVEPTTESGEPESEATEETGEPEKAEGSEEPEGAVEPTTEDGEPESEATEETGEPEKVEGSEEPEGAVDPATESGEPEKAEGSEEPEGAVDQASESGEPEKTESGEPESEATEETGEPEKAEGSEEPEGAVDPTTEGGEPESEATEETGEPEKAEGSEGPDGAVDPASESGEPESEATEETGEAEKTEGSEEPEGAVDPAIEGGEPESEATEETGEPEKAEGSEEPEGAVAPASESGEGLEGEEASGAIGGSADAESAQEPKQLATAASTLENAVAAPASYETQLPVMALAAPQATEGTENEPPVDNGETEMEEDYAVNAGSAYLTINGVRVENTVYTNDTASNAIHNALLGAIERLGTNLPGTSDGIVDIRVTVSAGTYEGGVDLGAGGEDSLRAQLLRTIKGANATDTQEPIANISIVAEDAMETDENGNENPTVNASGKAVIEGDLIFDGFNTLLAGIYIGLNSKINAANADSFDYYGTQLDDHVDIETESVQEVTVDTGAGDDTVNLVATQEPTVHVEVNPQAIEEIITTQVIEQVAGSDTGSVQEIASKENFEQFVCDTVEQIKQDSVSGSGKLERAKVTVRTGEGDDVANVKVVNSMAFGADALSSTDPNPGIAYSFSLDFGATDVSIDLGDGADEVNVSGGTSMLYGRKALQAVLDFAQKQLGTNVEGSHIVIDAGAGDDTVVVDTTAAYFDFFGADVRVNSGAGFDRVHLTGELAEVVDVKDRISGNNTRLSLETQAEIQVFDEILGHFVDENPVTAALALRQPLEISLEGAEAITDLLDNKASVSLNGAEKQLAVQPFTDYILSADMDGRVSFAVTVTGDGFMSNLLVKAAQSATENRLIVDKLEADGLNVFLIAPEIEVGGSVVGENVVFVAQSLNSEALDASLTIAEDDLTGEKLEFGFDFIEASEKASISVLKGASIYANGFVDMLAQTLQTGGYIDIKFIESLDMPHFVVAKFGTASVDIHGAIQANKGFVHAQAKAYNDFDASDLLALIPLSFGVGGVEAKVTLGDGANINAGAGANFLSDTRIYVNTFDKGSFPKFSVSLAGNVVTADTQTLVSGNAKILAADDVRVDARSRAASYAVSMAEPTDVALQTAKSGIFLGANFAMANTKAQVLDSASVESRAGDVAVEADGMLLTRTYAISSPVSVYATDEDGNTLVDADGNPVTTTQTASVLSLVTMVEEILGHVPKEVDSIKGKLIGGITGSNSLAIKFNSSTEPPKDAVTQASTQLVGALALAFIDNEVSALINTANAVKAAGEISLRAWGETTSSQRADGSLYENASLVTVPGIGMISRTTEASNNAVGVGVTIGVFGHDVSAIAQKGAVTAGKGLDVSADSRRVHSSLASKAGHIPATSSFGLGGAVTVHIASARNEARLANTAKFDLEGAVHVGSSIAHGAFETIGDASGKRVRKSLSLGLIDFPLIDAPTYRSDSLGVGAGIAVGVIGVDVSAVVEDGVTFNNENKLDNLEIEASFSGTEELRAAAGAAGGISATPVVATDISGVMVEAYLGKADETAITAGDITVTAQGTMERKLTADAAAAGTRVGAGAALAVSVFNDSATADVLRGVDAGGDVRVGADSVSRLDENVKASTSGALPANPTGSASTGTSTTQDRDGVLSGNTQPSGNTVNSDVRAEADKQADEALARGGKLAGEVNTKNVNTQNVTNAAASRQYAQTSEGSIQVAAALAVNILNNLSRAKVHDGNDILALGDIVVLARNDTDAVIAANASATDSLYGLGVAVAVNNVTHENIAYLGTGSVQGRSLTVAAEIYEKEEAKALEDAFNDLVQFLADNGAMGELIDVVRERDYESSAVNQLDVLLAKDQWTDEERASIAAYVDELIDATLWKDGDEVTLRERIYDLILASWDAAYAGTPITRDHAYGMETYVREALRAHYMEETAPENALYSDVCAGLISELIAGIDAYRAEQAYKQRMITLACDLAEGKTLTAEEQAALNAYLGMEANQENMRAIRQMILDEAMAQMTGQESALKTLDVYPAAFEKLLNDQLASLANVQAWIFPGALGAQA